MNYLKQINFFWRLANTKPLSKSEGYLYLYLLNVANQKRQDVISVSREVILEKADLDKSTYYKARARLKELGLIDYKNGVNRLDKCTFTIIQVSDISDSNTKSASDFSDAHSDTDSDTDSDDIYKGSKVFQMSSKVVGDGASTSQKESDFEMKSEKKPLNSSNHAKTVNAVSEKTDSKEQKHLFQDSKYADYQVFKMEFEANELYACYDSRVIHEEMRLASKEKGLMYSDWLITGQKWCIKEKTDKFLIKNIVKNGNSKSNNGLSNLANETLARIQARKQAKNSDNQ